MQVGTSISAKMKATLPAKFGVYDTDMTRMHSKYGGILKQQTKSNLIGHLNNIFHFKNRKESDQNKVLVANYDEQGKKIKVQYHENIDDPDQVYVAMQKSGSQQYGAKTELVSASEFRALSVSKSPSRDISANNNFASRNQVSENLLLKPDSERTLKQEEMQELLVSAEKQKRILVETEHELVQSLLKRHRQTVRLLRPRGGIFNLSNIFTVYAITNKDEEAKFVKRVHHIQKLVNRKIANGALSFEKMDEVAIVEFVLKIVSKFETKQQTFKSVTRDQRNQTNKLRDGTTLFIKDDAVPPVGSYRPKHQVIEKQKSNAIISPTRQREVLQAGNLHQRLKTMQTPEQLISTLPQKPATFNQTTTLARTLSVAQNQISESLTNLGHNRNRSRSSVNRSQTYERSLSPKKAASTRQKMAVFTPVSKSGGGSRALRRLFSGLPSQSLRQQASASVRTKMQPQKSQKSIKNGDSRVSMNNYDMRITSGILIDQLKTADSEKMPPNGGGPEQEKPKKISDFSKMVGRDQISSLRKGQHLNKILMSKENSIFSSPKKNSMHKLRISGQIDHLLNTQQKKPKNLFESGGRVPKTATLRSEHQLKKQNQRMATPSRLFSQMQHHHTNSDGSIFITQDRNNNMTILPSSANTQANATSGRNSKLRAGKNTSGEQSALKNYHNWAQNERKTPTTNTSATMTTRTNNRQRKYKQAVQMFAHKQLSQNVLHNQPSRDEYAHDLIQQLNSSQSEQENLQQALTSLQQPAVQANAIGKKQKRFKKKQALHRLKSDTIGVKNIRHFTKKINQAHRDLSVEMRGDLTHNRIESHGWMGQEEDGLHLKLRTEKVFSEKQLHSDNVSEDPYRIDRSIERQNTECGINGPHMQTIKSDGSTLLVNIRTLDNRRSMTPSNKFPFQSSQLSGDEYMQSLKF